MEKKFSNRMRLLSMAALAMVGTILSGCGNDDSPADQQSARTVTLTTTISLGGEDGGAQTRALSIDETNHKGVKTFAKDDKIAFVYQDGDGHVAKAVSKDLKDDDISTDGKTAKITVTLTEPVSYGRLILIYPAAMAKATIADDALDDRDGMSYEENRAIRENRTVDFSRLDAQDGTLASLAAGLDLAVYDGSLTGDAKLPAGTLTLENRLAIGEFTIKNSGGTDITNTITGLTVSDGPNTYTVTRAAAAGPIFVAMRPVASDQNIYFSATTATTTAYFKNVTGHGGLAAKNMYPVNLTMATSKLVNLTALTDADVPTNVSNEKEYILNDGDVLTGTLDGTTKKYKISIAAGATVTLRDATINGEHSDDSHELWAGLTCLGDATIILEGDNAVRNFNRDYPGIQPAHNPKSEDPSSADYEPEYTLTIRGSGSLTATGTNFGAGIGTKYNGSCGNIRIEGGTVTANSNGSNSAGIGSSYNSTCGDITISGSAHVTATGSLFGMGAGIGTGNNSTCGNITISGSAQVTANGGGNGAGIGTGEKGTCGNITISGSAKVTATGGNFGAGIGTGYCGKCGDITISGSAQVTANGGGNGAGIGSGDNSTCGYISISGSVQVTANGGGNGAGIGTGNGGKCGSISISGGTVMAKGGSEATCIGTGRGDVDNKAECGDISITKGEGFVSVTAIRGDNATMSIGTTNGWNDDSYKCGCIMFGGSIIFDGDTWYQNLTEEGEDWDIHWTISTTDDGDESTNDSDNTLTLTPVI